jgi:hypothetical protein
MVFSHLYLIIANKITCILLIWGQQQTAEEMEKLTRTDKKKDYIPIQETEKLSV